MPDPLPTPSASETKPEEAASVLAGATDKPTTPDPAKTPEPADKDKGEATAKPEDKKADAAKVEPIDIKLPEGFNADPALLDEFKKLAAESGLKTETAQKLVEFQAKLNAATQANAKKEADEFSAKEAAWAAEAKKIPAAELGLAKRAMLNLTKDLPEALREETRSILQGTWMGNHPGVLRVLAAAGKFIAEDKVVEEGAGGKAPFTAADFYPTMNKKKA